MIEEIIGTLGFRDEEVRTYLSLMESGPTSASQIAKRAGFKRPATYVYLEALAKGGLVTQGTQNGVKVFIAEPGSKIKHLYARKIEALRKKEKALERILPQLAHSAGFGAKPRLQIFEAQGGLETALDDILSYKNIDTLTLWPIVSTMQVVSPDYYHYHNKERIRRNITIKGIWPRSQVLNRRHYQYMGSGPAFKRELRVAPKGMEFSMGYWVYANKVLCISSKVEGFGFILESAEFAAMMATQQKFIWELSEPIRTKQEDVEEFLREMREEHLSN